MSKFIRSKLCALLLISLSAVLPALPAAAQVTSLSMTSDSGDYIGLGQTYYFTPADGTFVIQGNYDNGVTISFSTPSYNQFWSMDFAAANNVQLTAGSYLNATRFPFQAAGVPGFDVVGDGRGCNGLTGSFQVLQVVYDATGTPTAFDATFEQHCEGATAALRGEIRYNANVPLYLSAPSNETVVQNQQVTFTVTANDAAGLQVPLSATQLPPGASFVDLRNSTGSFSWTPSSGQSGQFIATFAGSDSAGNSATVSTAITVIPPPPVNDDFSAAVAMPGIPSTYTEDATTATTAPDDPWCYGNAQSVWFKYTPSTNMRIEANTFGSNYDTTLGVFTGNRGALTPVSCNDYANNTFQSRVRFDAVAGTTYYFMVSSGYFPSSAANLVFNLAAAPPPFSFTPTVEQFGTVVASTGQVTLSGTVTCNEPAYVILNGEVKQTKGGVPVNGFWEAFVPCNGATPWTANVLPWWIALRAGHAAALFGGGKADVGVQAGAVDPDTGEFKGINFATIVTLRAK